MRSTTLTLRGKTVEVCYFDSRFFEMEGRQYEIVGTAINGSGIMDAEHRVKGETEIKTVKHETLVSLFKACKIQTIKRIKA